MFSSCFGINVPGNVSLSTRTTDVPPIQPVQTSFLFKHYRTSLLGGKAGPGAGFRANQSPHLVPVIRMGNGIPPTPPYTLTEHTAPILLFALLSSFEVLSSIIYLQFPPCLICTESVPFFFVLLNYLQNIILFIFRATDISSHIIAQAEKYTLYHFIVYPATFLGII